MYSQTQSAPSAHVAISGKPHSYRTHRREVHAFNDITWKLNFSYEPIVAERVASPMQHLLAEILVKAGIISYCDSLNAHHIGRSKEAKESFAYIVDMFNKRLLSIEQTIVAINHIHLTDAPLTEALLLVRTTPGCRVVSESVIDFLKQTGLVSDKDIERLNLGKFVDSKLLLGALVSASVFDTKTLRNATRLRYLLNRGKLNFEQAKEAIHFCVNHNLDVEQHLGISISYDRRLVDGEIASLATRRNELDLHIAGGIRMGGALNCV